MSLHILAKVKLLAECQALLSQADALLFIEDGVYALINNAAAFKVKPCALYALDSDLSARGIDPVELPPSVEVINHARFVELSCEQANSVSWY